MPTVDTSLLEEMGFSKTKINKALAATGNSSSDAAMEWLIAHADEIDDGPVAVDVKPTDAAVPMNEDAGTSTVSEEQQSAKSLKCDECGKLFKAQLEVEFHAGKTGHSSFSESTEEKKPLTEEEKQDQLRKVEEKLKQKRKEREEQEKNEALDREKIRIKSGKEMNAAKKKLEEEEMKKIVEQRRREKLEDQQARQRIKEKIEQDKIARRVKFGMSTPAETNTPEPVSKPVPQPIIQSAPQKDYLQTKLNIRLTNGQILSQTFGAKEELSAVRLYIELNRTDGAEPFSMMTNFPKKVFSTDDYEKPLDSLGLVPSAVIIVTKSA